MAGDNKKNVLTMRCTKYGLYGHIKRMYMTLRCIGRNTVRDLFTSSIIEFTWNILTFKMQPVSKVITDKRSNQKFVYSFERLP